MSIPIDIIIAISVWSGLWILYKGVRWWLFWYSDILKWVRGHRNSNETILLARVQYYSL